MDTILTWVAAVLGSLVALDLALAITLLTLMILPVQPDRRADWHGPEGRWS